jgi:hypothetical protein
MAVMHREVIMNGSARLAALILSFLSFFVSHAFSQVLMQPTPVPTVTAEHEPWYLNGDPITYAGNLYYPAGAQIFFSPSDMVRSGFYEGIPLYIKTTIEPYSVVYVPLAGGRMQPYERPRSGALTGTAGSTPSSVIPPPETIPPEGLALQAAGPPTQTTRVMPVQIPRPDVTAPAAGAASPEVTGTSGRVSSPRPPMRTQIGGRPQGTNSIFIEFQNSRWYPLGPPEPIDRSGLARVGEVGGFGVFAEREGSDIVYVPVTRDSSLAVAYSRTRRK